MTRPQGAARGTSRLTLAAIFGTSSPSGKGVGPFLSLTETLLPQPTSQERRTAAFTVCDQVGSLAGALGALATGLPPVLRLSSFHLLVAAHAQIRLALVVLFLCLSPAVEPAHRGPEEPPVTRVRGLTSASIACAEW